MSLFAKICGIAGPEALDAAVEAGADAVGFVFHGPSPRDIAPRAAAALVRRLPAGVLSVAVTLHPDRTLVARILEEFVPDAWQSEAADLAALELPASVERWPVFRHAGATAALPRRAVFDAAESGRGMRGDWQCAAALARRCELILAGGLDAANVAQAVAAVRPFGVDVSSGIERRPGVKDPALIRAFLAAARSAGQRRSA
jgi:phosphoribosylanthranilate isomerase